MTNYGYPINRPDLPALASFEEEFRACLASGQVTNGGQHVRQFERALEEYLGTHVCVVSSGQTALMILLEAIGVRGKKVMCPSFTFWGTPSAIHWAGATPVFCDIDDSLTVDYMDIIARSSAGGIAAIVGVDVYGSPCDYHLLSKTAQRLGTLFICDSAPAFGAHWFDRPIGEYGAGQIFSFHATKPFSTMEGGCISSIDGNLIERCRSLRNFGQIGGVGHSYGMNGKMMEVCALIGLQRLKDWPAVRQARVDAAAIYREALSRLEGITLPFIPTWSEPIWCYMPVILDRGIDRDRVIASMAKGGVEARKYYQPCRGGEHLPVTSDISTRVLALPMYNHMSAGAIMDIVGALEAAINEQG